MTRPVTLSEPHFSQHTLNKYASLMAQGNGYLGLRASHEEDYTRQTRGMYLAGLYHRAGKGEINELVNLPDILGMEIAINGEVFSLSAKPGSVNLTLPVENYAVALSGVPATAQVTPSPAVALFRQTNCRSLCWKSLLRHWTPTRQC
ncbi:glycosyl hydrolase [Escherichia coli]|uniref:Glycosyl hydrolase n=1 Tax=Escherichia coli TaxID=562 RepID=A0A376UAK1_ECOLX|nr:glycosyl hydrolase [Escherichia coli]